VCSTKATASGIRLLQRAALPPSQVDTKLEAVRQEFVMQFGLDVDPLHKDLHDLLDMQTQAGGQNRKARGGQFRDARGLADIPEELSTRLIDWRPFMNVGNTIPPRDPDDDEEDEEEEDRTDEPPVVREPDED
jgi:hypothetical protein